MYFARTERGNTRGDGTKSAAIFTHFLPQKYTPLSSFRIELHTPPRPQFMVVEVKLCSTLCGTGEVYYVSPLNDGSALPKSCRADGCCFRLPCLYLLNPRPRLTVSRARSGASNLRGAAVNNARANVSGNSRNLCPKSRPSTSPLALPPANGSEHH